MFTLDAYRLFLVMGALHAFATQLIYPVLAIYYVQTVTLNPLQLVFIGTVLELTIFVLEVPTGVLADSLGRRPSVISGYALIGLCFVLEGLIPLFAAIVVAEMIRGAGETLISGARDAWLADEIGSDRRGLPALGAAAADRRFCRHRYRNAAGNPEPQGPHRSGGSPAHRPGGFFGPDHARNGVHPCS